MSEEVRSWRLHLRSGTEPEDIASWINPVVRGWMTFYGRFYKTALHGPLQRINPSLVRWAKRKYKGLRSLSRSVLWEPGAEDAPGRPAGLDLGLAAVSEQFGALNEAGGVGGEEEGGCGDLVRVGDPA